MLSRVAIVTACMVAGAVYLGQASRSEVIPPRQPLAAFPLEIGGWSGRPAPELDPKVLAVLGVDEFVNRVYQRPDQPPVGLYVGYYSSQRQGDTIHSPLNCLPGSGWVPIKAERVNMATYGPDRTPRSIEVNHYVVQQGLDKLVVLYWYQSHGRVTASEYWSKLFMVRDAIVLNRTDAALVRVISPAINTEPAAETAARQQAIRFVEAIFPMLGRYLPA